MIFTSLKDGFFIAEIRKLKKQYLVTDSSPSSISRLHAIHFNISRDNVVRELRDLR